MEEDFAFESTLKSPIMSQGTGTGTDVFEEDACSICLEPFSSEDPASVTSCKHEYHLQCILEWSQRSKECPICWQLLVLKDPSCQELLAAVEIERNSRSRRRSANTPSFARITPEDFDFDHVLQYTDDSDFDEHIMQHLSAAALGRTHHFSRRQRQRSSGMGPSQFVNFAGPSSESDGHHIYTTTPVDSQSSSNSSSPENGPSTVAVSSERHHQPPSDLITSHVTTSLNSTENRHGSSRPRVLESQASPESPGSPKRSRPSELFSFSESLKSKFSAASARYKESISKGTRGLKEKLLARNNSVKELSKEVQREVTAGIAGVARMMERLDPSSKRTGLSDPAASDVVGPSHIPHNGKIVPDNLISQPPDNIDMETACSTQSNSPVVAPRTTPLSAHEEITRVQDIL